MAGWLSSRQLPDELGGVHGDLGDAGHVGVEHHLPLEGGGGVIEMEDNVLGSVYGLKGLADQMLSGLDQHLDGHVVGDVAALNEGADKLIFGLGGGGEAHLDLFHTDIHQRVEQLQLLLHVHGINEGLVAVPQVHGAPDGGRLQFLVGPGALFHFQRDEGDVLFLCGFHNSSSSLGQGIENAPDQIMVRGVRYAVPPCFRPPSPADAHGLQQGPGR